MHLHTPASADYREPNITYLDILKKAEQKGLDIIAITDHNTAAGYRRYMDEVEDLELLERRNRLTPEEKEQLQEFRRLREKILVLPGFELMNSKYIKGPVHWSQQNHRATAIRLTIVRRTPFIAAC